MKAYASLSSKGILSLSSKALDDYARLKTTEEQEAFLAKLREDSPLVKKAARLGYSKVRHSRVKSVTTEKINRADIIQRDKGTCYLCGDTPTGRNLTLDHVVPIVRGGLHCSDNLRVACRKCNSNKSSMTIEELAQRKMVLCLYT
jgi:hypothetical protein